MGKLDLSNLLVYILNILKWMFLMALMDHCLALGKKSDKKRILSYTDGEGPYNVYIEVLDKQGGTIRIPLADGIPSRDAQHPSPIVAFHQLAQFSCRWDLVPRASQLSDARGSPQSIIRLPNWLRKKVYEFGYENNWYAKLSEEVQALVDHAWLPENNPSLMSGWLYLFKDNFLWREIAVNDGLYEEVDLNQYAGKDIRPSSGVGATDILLVHKTNNTIVENRIVYSPVQWSWPRINYYGGMDSNDVRVSDESLLSQFPSEDCIQRQEERITKINLEDVINDIPDDGWLFPTLGPPIFFLPDPLGIALRWQLNLTENWLALQKKISDIANKDFYHLATLCYHFFYNKEVHSSEWIYSEWNNMPTPQFYTRHVIKPSQTNTVFEASQYLDKSMIEQLLEVEDRKSLRGLICFLQQSLLSAIDNDDYCAAMGDYFSGGVKDYENGFVILMGMLNLLNESPETMDYCLDIEQGNRTPVKFDLLSSALYQHYFPDIDDYHIALPTTSMEISHCKDDNDGSGHFRKILFASLYQHALNNNPFINMDDGSMIEVSNHMVFAVDGMLSYLLKSNDNDSAMKLAYALISSTAAFSGIILSKQSDISSGSSYIFGLGTLFKTSAKLNMVPSGEIPIHEDRHVVGYASPMSHAGVATQRSESRQIVSSMVKEKLLFQLKMTGLDLDSFHNEKDIIHGIAGKGTASIYSLLALINLSLVIKEALGNKQSLPKNIYEFSNAITNLLVTMKDVSDIVLGSEYVEEILSDKKLLSYFMSDNVELLGLLESRSGYLSLSFSLIGILLSIRSIYQDLYARQPGQVVGSSIMLLGNSMVVSSQVGKALLNQFKKQLSPIYKSEVLTEETSAQIIKTLFAELSDIEAIVMYAGAFQWVGTVLVLGGILLKKWLQQDQLIVWAKHCPFSRDLSLRCKDQYAYWQDPKNEKYIIQSLFNLYLVPQIGSIKEIQGHSLYSKQFVVDILLGRFIPDVDIMQLKCTWYLAIQSRFGNPIKPILTAYQEAIPASVTQVKNEKGQIEKMVYFFDVPRLTINRNSQRGYWGIEVKARLLLDGGEIQLPSKPLPHEQDARDLWVTKRSWSLFNGK